MSGPLPLPGPTAEHAHSASPPAVLPYADNFTANELNGRRLIFRFCLGLITGGAAFTAFIAFTFCAYKAFPLSSCLAITASLIAATLLNALFARFAVGLFIWRRQRSHRQIRYRGFAFPFLFGCAGGFICTLLSFQSLWWLLANLILSVLAALILCRRGERQPQVDHALHEKYRRTFASAGTVLLCILLAGFTSAWISRHACERHMANLIAARMRRMGPFHFVPHADPDAARIFTAAGLTPLPAGADDAFQFPWADVRAAKITGIFTTSVQFGWCAGPAAGAGGKMHFLCIFGWPIETYVTENWIS